MGPGNIVLGEYQLLLILSNSGSLRREWGLSARSVSCEGNSRAGMS